MSEQIDEMQHFLTKIEGSLDDVRVLIREIDEVIKEALSEIAKRDRMNTGKYPAIGLRSTRSKLMRTVLNMKGLKEHEATLRSIHADGRQLQPRYERVLANIADWEAKVEKGFGAKAT